MKPQNLRNQKKPCHKNKTWFLAKLTCSINDTKWTKTDKHASWHITCRFSKPDSREGHPPDWVSALDKMRRRWRTRPQPNFQWTGTDAYFNFTVQMCWRANIPILAAQIEKKVDWWGIGFALRNNPDKRASILVSETPKMVDFHMGLCASDWGLQNTIQDAANFLWKQEELMQLGVWMLTLPRAEPPDDFAHAAVQQIHRAWPALGYNTDQSLHQVRVLPGQHCHAAWALLLACLQSGAECPLCVAFQVHRLLDSAHPIHTFTHAHTHISEDTCEYWQPPVERQSCALWWSMVYHPLP